MPKIQHIGKEIADSVLKSVGARGFSLFLKPGSFVAIPADMFCIEITATEECHYMRWRVLGSPKQMGHACEVIDEFRATKDESSDTKIIEYLKGRIQVADQ